MIWSPPSSEDIVVCFSQIWGPKRSPPCSSNVMQCPFLALTLLSSILSASCESTAVWERFPFSQIALIAWKYLQLICFLIEWSLSFESSSSESFGFLGKGSFSLCSPSLRCLVTLSCSFIFSTLSSPVRTDDVASSALVYLEWGLGQILSMPNSSHLLLRSCYNGYWSREPKK